MIEAIHIGKAHQEPRIRNTLAGGAVVVLIRPAYAEVEAMVRAHYGEQFVYRSVT